MGRHPSRSTVATPKRIVRRETQTSYTWLENQGFLEESSYYYSSSSSVCSLVWNIKMNQSNNTNNEETASIGEELDENFVFNDSSSLNRYEFISYLWIICSISYLVSSTIILVYTYWNVMQLVNIVPRYELGIIDLPIIFIRGSGVTHHVGWVFTFYLKYVCLNFIIFGGRMWGSDLQVTTYFFYIHIHWIYQWHLIRMCDACV